MAAAWPAHSAGRSDRGSTKTFGLITPEYVTYVLNENFEDAKALFLAPLMAIHYAHLVMLAEQGIVSPSDAHAIRDALDGDVAGRRPPRRRTTAPTRISSSTSIA